MLGNNWKRSTLKIISQFFQLQQLKQITQTQKEEKIKRKKKEEKNQREKLINAAKPSSFKKCDNIKWSRSKGRKGSRLGSIDSMMVKISRKRKTRSTESSLVVHFHAKVPQTIAAVQERSTQSAQLHSPCSSHFSLRKACQRCVDCSVSIPNLSCHQLFSSP